MAKINDYTRRMKDWPRRSSQTWTLLSPAEFEKLKPTLRPATPISPPPAEEKPEALEDS